MSNRAAGKQDAKPGLTPKLRFPKFRDAPAWKAGQLSDALSSLLSGLSLEQGNHASGYRVTRIETISDGSVDLEKVGFVKTSQDISAYRLAVGDILLSNINSLLHIGKSVFIERDYDLYHGMNLLRLVVDGSRHNARFISHLLTTDRVRASIRKRANKAVNQASINQTELGKTQLELPSPAEQQKVAECLTTLDEVIAAQSQKLAALKTHKKGLMQQLFPREGETLPHVRFPEFREQWVETQLGQICDSISSGRDQIDFEGVFDLYGSTSVIGKTQNPSFSGERILVARVGANAGYLTKVDGQFGVTDNTLVVSLNPSANIDFIFHYLANININRLIFGSGQPLITGSILKNLSIQVPTDSEQQRIANCLTSLDSLIAAESAKLQALKTHKKGMMQQLFPSPGEAEV